MAKLQVAFYKSSKGEIDDKAIDLLTGRDGFSHCELLLSSKHTIAAHYLNNGVVHCYYNDITNDDKWVVLEREIDKDLRQDIINEAKKLLGTTYDTKGVICTALLKRPLCVSPKSTWCSKMIADVLFKESIDLNIMPNGLFNQLIKDGWINKTSLQAGWKIGKKQKPEIDRFGRIRIEGNLK